MRAAGAIAVLSTESGQDSHSLLIREITIADAAAAASLSGEFGYPVSPEAMERRIRNLALLRDHVVYVACLSDRIAGWIDVGIVHHLQVETYGEIGGLVVASDVRGNGIGRQLVAKAEQWVSGQGISTMLVRSQIARARAHGFYLQQGYSRTKTSAVFSKMLHEL